MGDSSRPGWLGRLRSQQAGRPAGLLGRIIGRAMVKDTGGHNDRCLELLALDAPSTVLEVGYGQGRTAALVLGAGHRVLGVEVSETMRDQATARNRQAVEDGRAELVVGDGVRIPFPDDSAEAAFTTHTIYFMPDPAATIAEVARVVRAGGRFVIACHVGDDPMRSWMDPEIYRVPKGAEIEAMLASAGFALTERHDDSATASYPTHWFVADLPATAA